MSTSNGYVANPRRYRLLLTCLAVVALPAVAHARDWSDSTGRYRLKADLIAYDDNTVVLQKGNRQLASLKIKQLSKADQDYVRSEEAATATRSASSAEQTWTTRNGLKINGRVVGYVRKEIVVQRRRGKLYVNDRLYDNLPGVYKRMLPAVIEHFEGIPTANEKELMAWAVKTKGLPHTYLCEGVTFELENGDEYAAPFFLLSDEDWKVLEPGWLRWKKAADAQDREVQRAHEEVVAQAQAQAYQRDHQANQQAQHVELALLAANAGITTIWEVGLSPKRGVAAQQLSVIVPARDSRQAQIAAMNQHPGYVAGPVRRLSY